MRVLDLFAGIGGLALGLEWAGMETAGLSVAVVTGRAITDA